MSVVEMEKINIILHNSHLENTINYLQSTELLEIISLKGQSNLHLALDQESMTAYEYDISEVKHFFNTIKKYDPDKVGFIESFMGEKEEVKEEQLYQNFKSFDYKKIIGEAEVLENRLQHLTNEEINLKEEKNLLNNWISFKHSLSSLKPTAKFHFILGKLLIKQLKPFKDKLFDLNPYLTYEIIEQDKRHAKLIIAIDTSKEKELQNILDKINFSCSSLPQDIDTTPKDKLMDINNKLIEIHDKKLKIKAKVKDLLKYKKNMSFLYDYLIINRDRACVREHFWATKSVIVIEGWLIKNKFNELKTKLKEFGKEIELLAIEPGKDEKIPVIIKNPPLITPFETITNIFGNPNYGEIDPTISLSFFFIFFFALCLSDAGYGLILALMALYLKKRYKLHGGIKKLIQLLLYCGIATIPVGALMGGWFGIPLNDLPESIIKTILISIRIINPMKSTLVMLGFSLLMGIIQILTGLIIKFYCNIKNKNYKSAFLDDFLWLFFLISLLFFISTKTILPDLDFISTKLAILGGVLLVLTQGRSKKNIFGKFFSGLVSLYKTSAYMGDVLSYARLLALGLTSSVIGMIINIIALLAKNIPFIGWIIMLIILIIGHLFNVIISTLGAFIHSVRLQLVEYFGKFFEGGGKAFKPFKIETKYTLIK